MARNINQNEKYILWGMSAGRCELCNKLLGMHPTTKETGNFAENAHIHAYSPGGARYMYIVEEQINSLKNVMLLCQECHTLIDRNPGMYPAEFLFTRKYEHEMKVFTLMESNNLMKSQEMYYFANIKGYQPNSDYALFDKAVVSKGYQPKTEYPINLGYDDMPISDGTEMFYDIQCEILEKRAKEQIDIANKKDAHISVFAIAPMPLLVKLGTVLRDIGNITVFQCHRIGEKWSWSDDTTTVDYHSSGGENNHLIEDVALNISLSADIVSERIEAVHSFEQVYKITIEEPNRNFVTNETIVNDFVDVFRNTLERIKQNHNNLKRIHVFMAMPTSLAIRMGMDYMPKTDPVLVLYDQINPEEPFRATIKIGG